VRSSDGSSARRRRATALIVVSLVVAGCQAERRPPTNTNSGGTASGTPIGVGSGTSGSGSSSSSGTTTSTSASSGAGGAAPYAPTFGELTCADSLAHDPDCESCMFYQMGQFCSEQWIACGDDSYCETGFHDCSLLCKGGDFKCLVDCFNEEPDALDLVLEFNGCVCMNCPDICK
jgi:hypothetical protein